MGKVRHKKEQRLVEMLGSQVRCLSSFHALGVPR